MLSKAHLPPQWELLLKKRILLPRAANSFFKSNSQYANDTVCIVEVRSKMKILGL